jgi:hypothetical protein
VLLLGHPGASLCSFCCAKSDVDGEDRLPHRDNHLSKESVWLLQANNWLHKARIRTYSQFSPTPHADHDGRPRGIAPTRFLQFVRLSKSPPRQQLSGRDIMPTIARHPTANVPLIKLGGCQCRFPVSEDPSVTGGYRFCAASTVSSRVYCDHHHSIVTAAEPRRSRTEFRLAQRRAA